MRKVLTRLAVILTAAVSLASCVSNESYVTSSNSSAQPTVTPVKGQQVTFRASADGDSMTKTSRQDDGKVFWNPSDDISIFYAAAADGGARFTSDNAASAAVADFNGVLPDGMSLTETEFWGVYPYRADNAFDGSSVIVSIPSSQLGVADSFADNLFPTIAHNQGLNLSFYNLGGGVRFSVTRSDITSVTLKGNNGETLAGRVKASFSAGVPVVTQVVDAQDEVTLTAPGGGTFEVGRYYYIVTLPTVFNYGFSLTMNTATEVGVIEVNKRMEITRSTFGSITSADTKTSFRPASPVVDGTVHVIQERGNNLDLVILGDGFIDVDFRSGAYESIMNQAINEFFSVQPLSSFRDLFNIYYVDVVSPQRLNATNTGLNGATNSGNTTALSVTFTENSTAMSGDDDLAMEYAKRAFSTNANSRINNATIVVMANQACRAGTCWNYYSSESMSYDYGLGTSVAYCALGTSDAERRQLMHHEICGHGFGKLADEYYYNNYYPDPTVEWDNLQWFHEIGLYRNVDIYIDAESHATYPGREITTTSNVLWHDLFGTANSYESTENLGIYEGAKTVMSDFCRPTENANQSIMNHNTGIFNAISRRQILYRIRVLSGQAQGDFFSAAELNAFLDWDRNNFLNTGSASIRVPEDAETFIIAPPVNLFGKWVDGVFIED